MKFISPPLDRLRRAGDALWYGLLSGALILLVVALLASAASVRSEFCGLCHGQAKQALAASPHASQSCSSCHEGDDYAQIVEQRLAVVEMLVAKAVPGRESLEARVDNARCRSCHESALEGLVDNGSIRMSHRAVEQKNWSCSRCHGETSHSTSLGTSTYTMETCLSCHSANPANAATCESCHITPPRTADVKAGPASQTEAEEVVGQGNEGPATPWEVTHGPRAAELHGMGDLKTCSACHIPQFCASCHQMELPHPGDYLSQHGAQVTTGQVTEQACYTCHQRSACESCHRVPMPHPDSYLQDHAVEAGKSKKDCSRCHDEESCGICHERHVHPGVPKDVLDALRQRPVN